MASGHNAVILHVSVTLGILQPFFWILPISSMLMRMQLTKSLYRIPLLFELYLSNLLLKAIEVSDDPNHIPKWHFLMHMCLLRVLAWKHIELDDIFWTATKRDHHCHLYGELHLQPYPKQGLKITFPGVFKRGGLELLQLK